MVEGFEVNDSYSLWICNTCALKTGAKGYLSIFHSKSFADNLDIVFQNTDLKFPQKRFLDNCLEMMNN